METEVKLELTEKKGCFYATIDGKTESKMTFVFAGNDKIIIDHTEVNPRQQWKRIGKENG